MKKLLVAVLSCYMVSTVRSEPLSYPGKTFIKNTYERMAKFSGEEQVIGTVALMCVCASAEGIRSVYALGKGIATANLKGTFLKSRLPYVGPVAFLVGCSGLNQVEWKGIYNHIEKTKTIPSVLIPLETWDAFSLTTFLMAVRAASKPRIWQVGCWAGASYLMYLKANDVNDAGNFMHTVIHKADEQWQKFKEALA